MECLSENKKSAACLKQAADFLNKVASQTPGTSASEWAAGFRP